MRKAIEQEGMLILGSGQKIVRTEIIDDGQGIKYYYTVPESESKTVPESESKKVQLQAGSKEFEEMFPIVDIENVSLQDSFMSYEPENNLEKRVKSNIIRAKELGMKNFRKPCMDPSFADDGETIIYCAGEKPAVGLDAFWWNKNAPKFMPEKNSRQIDDLEKDVFLGIIIKYLVYEEEKKVKDAWKAVCVNSKDIGHYHDSKNPKRDFERTGSRKVGKWYDLGNTYKIVKRHGASGFVLFGGCFEFDGDYYPLAFACTFKYSFGICKYSVGELVLDV